MRENFNQIGIGDKGHQSGHNDIWM